MKKTCSEMFLQLKINIVQAPQKCGPEGVRESTTRQTIVGLNNQESFTTRPRSEIPVDECIHNV